MSPTGTGMDILVVSGSSRERSLNTRLAHLVSEARPADRVTVVTDLRTLPFYDGDVEERGTPAPVAELRAAARAADLVVVVTPEYNGTVPGLLGNAVDWLSRPVRQGVLTGKPMLVLSASPGRGGGARAAEHLRAVLAHLGAVVHPESLSVGSAHEQLDPDPSGPLLAHLAGLLDAAAQRPALAAPT